MTHTADSVWVLSSGRIVRLYLEPLPIPGTMPVSKLKSTQKEYRRRGLASICGARLILECLQRELYPSWDAHSRASLTLAEKLGYHYSHTYSAIEITLSPAAISGIV